MVLQIEGWQEQRWYSTGGTRAKKYIVSPNGEKYYFKRSEYKPAKDNKPEKYYKYEFWSEIVAYKIGQNLGFDTLKYDVAFDGDIAGCICQDMIDSEKEGLDEGIKYLQGFDNSFVPETNVNRKKYTFQLIEKSLAHHNLQKYIANVINIIIFDAIIGNTDRHQENWALINEYSAITILINEAQKKYDLEEAELENDKKNYKRGEKGFKRQQKKINRNEDRLRQNADLLQKLKLKSFKKSRFAPIYDNGSSCARELNDEKVIELLNNEEELMRYIFRGMSEIHWNERKISHFDLIRNLFKTDYKKQVIDIINSIKAKFNIEAIQDIINNIDNNLPADCEYLLPTTRKELIIKLITLRLTTIFSLIDE